MTLDDAGAAIAEHWGVPARAVFVSLVQEHGGWTARAWVSMERDERFSEVGLDADRAVEKLVNHSRCRAWARNEAWRSDVGAT